MKNLKEIFRDIKNHTDINSLKHYGVNFIASCFGVFGTGVAVGASITKEYCDHIYGKHWCWVDIMWDYLGILSGNLVHWLLCCLMTSI